jgi:hypothetical protein
MLTLNYWLCVLIQWKYGLSLLGVTLFAALFHFIASSFMKKVYMEGVCMMLLDDLTLSNFS